MTRFHCILLILTLTTQLLVIGGYAQTDEEVWTVCEVQPSFPGGVDSLKKFLADNIVFQYLAPEDERTGTVFVSVIVEKNGELSDVQILKGLGKLSDQETKRVIGLMPAWTPGVVKGQMVRAYYYFPVKFVEPLNVGKSKVLYSKEFKWTIEVPEGYSYVREEEWKRMDDHGADVLENTYGEEITNRSVKIFVLQKGSFNVFEANYQPYDEASDGDYRLYFKYITEVLYHTFKTQMPDAVIDSVSGVQIVSGLEFYTHLIKIQVSNGRIIYSRMFCRLFDNKDFTVNFTYVSEEEGNKMLGAWLNSKFE